MKSLARPSASSSPNTSASARKPWKTKPCAGQRYIAGGYLISNQLQGAVAGTLASNWLIGLAPEFLGEFVPKVRAVDAAQVQAIGKKYFAPEQQSIVVVGDNAVMEQLKAYGEFSAAK